MKVTYVGHSGFLVELEGCALLFDYYQGDIPLPDPEKKLYVFASHRHHDHFNDAVFDLAAAHPKVTYILSNDIRARREGLEILKTGPHKTTEVGKLSVYTLKSTDEGVAFIVEAEGKRIYHAGDLNLWVWEEEDPAYNDNMTKKYLRELDKITGQHFDLAFLPLDPRQEGDREGGMLEFLKRCTADRIFPMHMWEDHSVIPAFVENHPEYEKAIEKIEYPGQVFTI